MNYTVLSRKWRPKTFEDVVGQSHITKILQNSIAQNKISHAYLFSGPRGVGKTTVARIMSCNLNEVDSINQSIDIIELDGASNRGIDEIREIKESVRYAPSEGKYKIFIIDESHMLTKEAFNALLKTLEEPPSHVLFILATTEYHKLPLTIVSRCQRYSFKRISVNVITSYLFDTLKKEGFEVDEKALKAIAYKADGSLRDALSLLDKVITLSDNNVISNTIIKNALGIIDEEEYLNILKSVTNMDFKGTLEAVENILNNGTSIINFMDGFNAYLKDIVYYHAKYRKNISITKDTIEFLNKSKIDMKVASKLLSVNLEYLIKYNKTLSNISLENHFIKIFSYVSKINGNLEPIQKQTLPDQDKKTDNIINKKINSDEKKAKKNLNLADFYSKTLRYIEKNDYKLYCVLIKCSIEYPSDYVIKIVNQKLGSYEQNSISMEIEKINKIINEIAERDLSDSVAIKVKFEINNSKSQTINKDKNLSEKDNNENNLEEKDSGREKDNDENDLEEKDHPLFDSVLDELDGKLLK